MTAKIILIGTLDTKGVEIAYLKDFIEKRNFSALVIDVGVFPPQGLEPDISHEIVAEAAGTTMEEILGTKHRKSAIDALARGGACVLEDLYRKGEVSGALAVGGGTGTHIAAAMMRVLPIGLPKVIISTVVSRDVSPIVRYKDFTLIHAVADIAGLNFMTRKILADGALAIMAMVNNAIQSKGGRKVIALTSYGPLNQCAESTTKELKRLGYEVVPFHAVGSGTMAMEDLVGQGVIDGVLDLSLHELVDALYDGYCKDIGDERYETPGKKGLPHVILPGGLDMIAFECESIEGVPEPLRARKFLAHDFRSFVRTTEEDMRRIADMLADKLNRSPRPATVIIPLQGWSKADGPGAPFYDPAVNKVFTEHLKKSANNNVFIKEINAHINDPECAAYVVAELDNLLRIGSPTQEGYNRSQKKSWNGHT